MADQVASVAGGLAPRFSNARALGEATGLGAALATGRSRYAASA